LDAKGMAKGMAKGKGEADAKAAAKATEPAAVKHENASAKGAAPKTTHLRKIVDERKIMNSSKDEKPGQPPPIQGPEHCLWKRAKRDTSLRHCL
jgi:hypothetical protein